MKKFIITVIFVLSVFSFSACSCAEKPISSYISQLRSDVLAGRGETISATVFCEQRETPFINDTYIGEKKNFIIVRLPNLNENGVTVKVKFDNYTYDSDTEYNAIICSLTASIQVEKLPQNFAELTVTTSTTSETFTVQSNLLSTSITPLQALNSVISEEKDFINSLYSNGEFKAEIYIRLLVEENNNFYYIGFATGNNQITAFLLDATNGKIIAGKTD